MVVTRRAYSVLLQVLLYRRLADVEAAAADPTVTRPMQYAVHVENKHRVSVIKEQLSELSGIPAAWLQLADVYKGKFHQVRYAVLVTHHCDTWRLLSQAGVTFAAHATDVHRPAAVSAYLGQRCRCGLRGGARRSRGP